MGKLQKDQKGFSAIEVILVRVIVALVGVVGFMVYNNHKSKTTPVVSTTATKSTTTTPPKTTTPADPYAGWKSYCDTEGKACFKYPADWTQAENKVALSDTVSNVSSTVTSPAKTVNISYEYPYVKDGGDANFLTMSIDDVAGQPSLKIVGGIYPDTNNFDEYVVVGASSVTQYGLALGKTTQFAFTPRFSLSSNGDYQLAAIDASNGVNHTLTDAKAWFSTKDAKTALQLLQSFSTQ